VYNCCQIVVKKEFVMKKILMMLACAVICEPLFAREMGGGVWSIAAGSARVRAKELEKTLNWLKEASVSEKDMLKNLVENKLEMLASRINAIKLKFESESKLAPEQVAKLSAIEQSIHDKIDAIKALPAESKKSWREQMKLKFDSLSGDIQSFTTQVKSSLSEDEREQLRTVQKKAAKFAAWFKSLPASDQEALRQTIVEKVKKLKNKAGVLKQLGKQEEFKKLEVDVDDFVAHSEDEIATLSQKAKDLYERTIRELRTGK
jgi:hypothetical protein